MLETGNQDDGKQARRGKPAEHRGHQDIAMPSQAVRLSPARDGIATHLVGLRAALLALPSAIMMGLVATAAVLLAYR